MSETLFTSFQIKLFGRVVSDLKFEPAGALPEVTSGGKDTAPKGPEIGESPVEEELRGKRILARIYGFAFEGQYYSMPKPTIFLVNGPGFPPGDKSYLVSAFSNIDGDTPTTIDQSGTAERGTWFEDDVRMWIYDKGAHSIRFDVTAGKFEDILLEATLATMSRMAGREGELASREGELASREGEMASREGEMASRSGEMAFRARHRFK